MATISTLFYSRLRVWPIVMIVLTTSGFFDDKEIYISGGFDINLLKYEDIVVPGSPGNFII